MGDKLKNEKEKLLKKYKTSNTEERNKIIIFIGEHSKEVLSHLLFPLKNKLWYKVFATWRCSNNKCKNRWLSAYSWIYIDKYIENTPTKELKSHIDFLDEECKRCAGSNNKIIHYEHLKFKDEDELKVDETKPHMRELCEKCKAGYFCNKVDDI